MTIPIQRRRLRRDIAGRFAGTRRDESGHWLELASDEADALLRAIDAQHQGAPRVVGSTTVTQGARDLVADAVRSLRAEATPFAGVTVSDQELDAMRQAIDSVPGGCPRGSALAATRFRLELARMPR